jgi:hypothetical protein
MDIQSQISYTALPVARVRDAHIYSVYAFLAGFNAAAKELPLHAYPSLGLCLHPITHHHLSNPLLS